MIVSSSLTVGQFTFILRVAVQVLSYVGLFIVNVLILGHVPRVASLATHDVLNRIVGSSTATTSVLKWIPSRFRQERPDRSSHINLLLILTLSLSYTVFVSLSDVGFIGFHPCSMSGPTTYAAPASIDSSDKAKALITANMITGADPSLIKAYHCDSTAVIYLHKQYLNNCTSWRNSTYSDSTFFSGLNSTDSAVLMPLQLTRVNSPTELGLSVNAFYAGLTAQRVGKPIIKRGLAVVPHETGVRVVLGVPELASNTEVKLSKTMAIEVDVGCMSLGSWVSRSPWNVETSGYEFLKTTGLWRNYTGPEYMENVLHKTVDEIRAYLRPFYEPSTDGDMIGITGSNRSLSSAAHVERYPLPFTTDHEYETAGEFIRNCTEALQRQLGLPVGAELRNGTMCSLLGIGGTRVVAGGPLQGLQRMVCSAAAQVNMVDARVQMDAQGRVSLNMSRLPSDLTHVKADYWGIVRYTFGTGFGTYEPYERYALSDNANSPTRHFIRHTLPVFDRDVNLGQGTAGNSISYMGHFILSPNGGRFSYIPDKKEVGLSLLDEGFDDTGPLTPANVTRWLGQVGGSYALGSLAYNGWAALHATPVEVISTGGHEGLCYNPLYSLGFAPLVVSAVVIVCWTILLVRRGSWFGYGAVKVAYGGISPYTAATCPGAPSKETLATWESSSEPHLRVLSRESPLAGEAGDTALNYLKSSG